MEKIKRFIECLIPVTACNFKCSYCYVIQRNNNKGQLPHMKYSPEQIGEALNKERLGGCCYFSICGAGETLIPKDTVKIVKILLKNGHYVNITTNGTMTNRFREIVDDNSKENLERLHFSFSFHYLELVRTNNLEVFFCNINTIKKAGCSFLVQINLNDDYIPYLDEIKRICIEKVGAYPQVAATRKENNLKNVDLLTNYSKEEYLDFGREFNSPLFDFTMLNFNRKVKEFCYAGDWSFVLNLATGRMQRCYACHDSFDIIANPHKPIPFCEIGYHCKSLFCMNSSHFLSLGVIPTIDTPTYAELRNRDYAGWYSESMKDVLNSKLIENNKMQHHALRRIIFNLHDDFHGLASRIKKNFTKGDNNTDE